MWFFSLKLTFLAPENRPSQKETIVFQPSGQIITTSPEVTLNGGLIRELPQNPLNSGLGIILICPEPSIFPVAPVAPALGQSTHCDPCGRGWQSSGWLDGWRWLLVTVLVADIYIYILGVEPRIGVKQPQNGWFIMETPIKMDDLGVPLFLETSISGHITSLVIKNYDIQKFY